MQGRHSSNVGPRGLQPASNTVPPSLFLASHESDISIPPLDPPKQAKCQLFFTAPRAGGDWWRYLVGVMAYLPSV